jgi:hypothetical protein
MPLKLKKIERANPTNPGVTKWYLTKATGRVLSLDGACPNFCV